ncbi:hypothetical protein [Ruminococcus albus]|uniref:hypothetical protein n=1 Tax=Ruminococcus albus TaxID=1264 RepID=UPI000466C712|nr:hypothetical protein [Ruminococcus albus]
MQSYATFDGMTYMAVTMGAPMRSSPKISKKGEETPIPMYADDVVYYNFIDHINLYEWAFDTLVQKDFINEFSEVRDVKVGYGKSAIMQTSNPPADTAVCGLRISPSMMLKRR